MSQTRGVRLVQVHSPDENTETNVDIIAIHGLDTKSPDTWIWKSKDRKVNWLTDLLPNKVGPARIFTCDWPADLFQRSDLEQKTVEEFALLLLAGIKRRPPAVNDHTRRKDRPILFIASCLGGIILVKALVVAGTGDEYLSLRRATRGIVFLATPFRGTAFQDVANWAEPFLKGWASFQGQAVTKLLDSLKEPTFDLQELVRGFTQMCQSQPCQVLNFYETGKTDLRRKVFRFLPDLWGQAKPLVDRFSATLDIVPHPLALDRTHVMMNKFSGPEDPGYDCVAGKIEEILIDIRKNSLLEDADAWIRDKHYTADRLKVERLSDHLLPMDQCYINLAIVEQSGQDGGRSKKGDGAHQSSPVSLSARLKVEAPDEKIQIELLKIFNPRKDPDGQMMHPRRILIRGRAGVGKTTLCKKIIHDFTHDKENVDNLSKLFDRVLWVPLRTLKRKPDNGYNLKGLLLRDFFSNSPNRKDFAKELENELDITKFGRTLLVLDGLDEVSEGFDADSEMRQLLEFLLKQPNVIITSRPSARLPDSLHPDLELETIGFYPDQVKNYLEKVAFRNDQGRANEVQSFLNKNRLIQDLVRIPIQLDALCYTWDSSDSEAIPQSMTTVYIAIEQKLWKKDVLRLGKKHEGELVKKDDIQTAGPSKIEQFVKDETSFLEGLAFTGLHNDAIEFESKYLNIVSKHFTPSLLPDKSLPYLSFLRTSDPSSDYHNRNYHFLHLTFQEYFAARHFVQRWASSKQLSYLKLGSTKGGSMKEISTEKFLQREKYNGRYDIFWRFVAGLLWDYDEEQLRRFLEQIEDEPRDLLGPAHQRLLMHCFNEATLPDSEFLKDLRGKMELRCQQWSTFEYKLLGEMHLCRESEFPEKVLTKMLAEGSNNERVAILNALERRPQLSGNVLEEIAALLLEGPESGVRRSAALALGRQPSLPDSILQALVSRLEDPKSEVRDFVVQALELQPSLPDSILQALILRLEDPDSEVRDSAVWALGQQPLLPDNILQALLSQLEDPDLHTRESVVRALVKQSSLPDSILQALILQLEDPDSKVRDFAVWALGHQSLLPDNILQALVSRLEDPDSEVRDSTVWALGQQSLLPDNILQALVSQLEDPDLHTRESVIWALGQQPLLADSILQALVSRLEDPDLHTRESVIRALRQQPLLADSILQALVLRLEDPDLEVRDSAILALGQQPSLPDYILQALVLRLEDPDLHVRCSAVLTLGRQPLLPDSILQALVLRLKDPQPDVRRSAVRALGWQPLLSDSILQALMLRLEDPKSDIRVQILDSDHLHSIIPSVNTYNLQILLERWVKRSITEQFSCYVQDEKLYIETLNRRREIALCQSKNDFLKAFLTKASAMGRPDS
ncbi:hypothetical protein GJ744_005549 [Endocarpon pusillum]|uniref:NACHT domain-containing protein n=1 Tax=Endocarpon pusillum TaxID=364733 RepID=A0A8H7E7E9_9EURO|nr:hypothetical protein GJ744_005549 [Endocarpon pusillum]